MSRNTRKINETSTKKHAANVYYDGISTNEDPADYVRVNRKAVRLG